MRSITQVTIRGTRERLAHDERLVFYAQFCSLDEFLREPLSLQFLPDKRSGLAAYLPVVIIPSFHFSPLTFHDV